MISELLSGLWAALARAVAPATPMKISAWAEANRVLRPSESGIPGPWRNANAPHLAYIMDACAVPGVCESDICKPVQSGGSDALRNVIGYWATREPDPVGIALPSQAKGRKIVAQRLHPMLLHTPCLREILTPRARDLSTETIVLASGMMISLMWGGSATSMASDPMRRTVADETDKFEPWVGVEGDPIDLIRLRRTTYEGRDLGIHISTPTTRDGTIWQLLEACTVKLHYYCPCRYCGAYLPMTWPQIHWDVDESLEPRQQAAEIRRTEAVWYECDACGEHITQDQRAAMTRAGRWQQDPEDGPIIDAAGVEHECAETVEEFPNGTRLGFQFTALILHWLPWSTLVVEWILAQGSRSKIYTFRTNRLAEPADELRRRAGSSVYRDLVQAATIEEGIVPSWCAKLIATVDTQIDHFYLVIRAWGAGQRSHRVWHGIIGTWEELDQWLSRPWRNEDDGMAPRTVDHCYIDSGGTTEEGARQSRTIEVYSYCIRRRHLCTPIKGDSHPQDGYPVRQGKGLIPDRQQDRVRKRKRRGVEVRLWLVDTHHWGDELIDLVESGVDDGDQLWTLNTRDDPIYARQMAACSCVLIRRGHRERWEWHPSTRGSRIDFWHCEAYQCAAAWLQHIHTLPTDADALAPLMAPHRRPPSRRRVGVMAH